MGDTSPASRETGPVVEFPGGCAGASSWWMGSGEGIRPGRSPGSAGCGCRPRGTFHPALIATRVFQGLCLAACPRPICPGRAGRRIPGLDFGLERVSGPTGSMRLNPGQVYVFPAIPRTVCQGNGWTGPAKPGIPVRGCPLQRPLFRMQRLEERNPGIRWFCTKSALFHRFFHRLLSYKSLLEGLRRGFGRQPGG